jgi:two-component SAPR family response regulator
VFGPVEVVDRDGRSVSFERSKPLELLAWMAMHRDRSTRSAARAALWANEVRDATFANVVSDARRSLARLVPSPAGEEWIGRIPSDELPLHDRIRSDADLLEHALATARLQTPIAAIATLRRPVEAIAGPPFEGMAYLWPDAEGATSSLILLPTSAAVELARHCLAVGDVDGARRATDAGLRVLPGHQELVGLRMRAHACVDDHAAVRREWNRYEQAVNADPWSDGEASPELVELRKELLNPRR